jgi:RNA polymerase sigma-70 factor (ECF subfamily)
MDRAAPIETAFRSAERRLWRLCYHMTGVAADADELVQEAFVRAMESERELAGPDLERWLIRVATNLSVDCLRRRKRRAYPGSWLPSPLETGEQLTPPTRYWRARRIPRERRAGRRVSYAFLVALEALSPRARAVLLLIDVLDYSAAEVATILDASEGNVACCITARAARSTASTSRSSPRRACASASDRPSRSWSRA